MAIVSTITDALNLWAEMGVFSYVIPFLLIFAVVFAILQKTRLLGENKGIITIVSIAIGLLALIDDYVPVFFATIFPRFGIGLSVFLVLVILIGFFYQPTADGTPVTAIKWIGWLTGIGVVIWAITSWGGWVGSGYSIGGWLSEYFWSLLILGAVIAVIIVVAKSGNGNRAGGNNRAGVNKK
jgi:hypothetical protein